MPNEICECLWKWGIPVYPKNEQTLLFNRKYYDNPMESQWIWGYVPIFKQAHKEI